MTSVHQVAAVLAPWQSIYSNSKLVSVSVTAAHLTALVFSGGLAVAADRTTLRLAAAPDVERGVLLKELHAVHRPVLIALSILVTTGILLAAADFGTFALSPIFWAKLVFVALLLINGAVLTSTESALRRPATDVKAQHRLWRRLQLTSWCSITLWATTLVIGVTLASAA
jgi:hypothetical protein